MTRTQRESIELTKGIIDMMHLENKHASEDINPACRAQPYSQACIDNAFERLDAKLCEIARVH